MRIRKRLAVLAAASSAILIGATGAGAITGGTPDGDNHPYVGALVVVDLDEGLASLCSGSLLSEDVFLTAGHCTDGAEIAFVWFDQSLPNPLTLASADAVGTPHTNPDFCLACGNGLPGFARRDVGVVTFDAVPGDLPSEFASLPSAGQVDGLKNKTPIDLIGYGVSFQAKIPGNLLPQPPPFFRWDGFGTRLYATSETISGRFVLGAEFMKSSQNESQGKGGACFGDSGGPILLGSTDTVLSVNSFGTNPNCSGVGYTQRVDIPAVLSWISSFMS